MSRCCEITWDGTPLCETFGLFVEGGTVDAPPPVPKTSYVTIPGGVDLDLTDALTGHAAFESRKVSFALVFDALESERDWQDVSRDVVNLLHGRRGSFELASDPGFTYDGRATVTGAELVSQDCGRITVEITASPWKLRQVWQKRVSAAGGVWVECESGRRPVHPTITCDYPVIVNWGGEQFVVPSGKSYRMNLVEFTQGKNRIWLNAYQARTATWADLAGQTWDDISSIPWAHLTVEDEGAGEFVGSAVVTLQWREEWL